MVTGTLAEGLGGGLSFLGNAHGNGNGDGKKKETGVGRRDSSFFAIDDSDSDYNSSDESTIAPRLDGGRTIVSQDSDNHISAQSTTTTKRKKGEKKPKSKSNMKLGHVPPSTTDTDTNTNTRTRTETGAVGNYTGSDTEVDTDEMDEIEIDELLPSSPVRFSPSETPTP
jgi:hypothetical protein